MRHHLRESEITTIDQIHLCNYCGEKALEHTSYSDHGRTCDVDYMCTCEGASISNGLDDDLYNVKQALERIETDVRLHTRQVHHTIKQKLFNQEVAKLKIKYEMEG